MTTIEFGAGVLGGDAGGFAGSQSVSADTGWATNAGVTDAMAEPVIAGALVDHSHVTNPKPVSASEYRAILMKTMI